MGSSMDRHSIEELIEIASAFNVDGVPAEAKPIGNGHINDTYLVTSRAEAGDRAAGTRKYILQRINHGVFSEPDKVMENITRVTDHLKNKIETEGGDPDRETFTVIRLRDTEGSSPQAGQTLYRNSDGTCWRMITYIDGTFTCESASAASCNAADIMYETGLGYGKFMQRLADFPAEELHETIPGFHDTRRRYNDLMRAFDVDIMGRATEVSEEIRFIRDREQDVDVLAEMVRKGELPLRITHNDTKLSNILFDSTSGKAICVIDLDTVMPGLAVTDFGDAIRSGASTGREDEGNPDKVRLDPDLYHAFHRGFIEGFPQLTQTERDMLAFGAKIMTLECGIRFLTDYLEGDTYFKTDHPAQNLARCRAQLALVRDMERKGIGQ
ncbi:MAG: aminoglycoside phosphotransferase family protein [Mogibacterium sp.]|nr:aminoglycoside phosphotransferase family protein [Mogibacterium sp.]